MSLEPGFQLGHYRITRSLGSGGMADVYEAQDTNLERTVALKILPIEYCRNPQLVARFQKEVRAAAKLNHRNIVTVFEVGQQDSHHYFSMRLLTGGDLRARIEGGLSPVEALAILREVADAFAHAHARGFVHRDVKPENIMFDEQGFPVLTDFGIAKALDTETRMTRTGMTMGTPRYLSPEQASGKPVDARADLYSLGIILYEMLTGRPPYDAEESMAVIFKHVTEPIPTLPDDFTRYQDLLNRLMAKDPVQRYGSAEELIRAIDALTPRSTGEMRQSQVGTRENPLVQKLLTPSPLRTPPPKTPRPVTPAPLTPAPAGSGEVAVRTPPVATRPPEAQAAPAIAVATTAAAAPVVTAPKRAAPWVMGAIAVVALAGSLLTWQALRPADTAAPAAAAPAPPTAPAARVVAPAANVETDASRATAERAARREQVRAEEYRRNQEEQAAAAKAAAADRAAAAARAAAAQNAATAEARRRSQAEEDARADALAQQRVEEQKRLAAEEAKQRAAQGEARKAAAAVAQPSPADAKAKAATDAAERKRLARAAAVKAKEEKRRQKAAARGDSDADGVVDKMDECPGTPAGTKVDENGCPVVP